MKAKMGGMRLVGGISFGMPLLKVAGCWWAAGKGWANFNAENSEGSWSSDRSTGTHLTYHSGLDQHSQKLAVLGSY